MKDSDYNLNNFSERETKNKDDSSNGQKRIIIVAIIAIIFIIAGVAVLFYFLLKDSDDTHTELVGQIKCLYTIKDASQETSLLGDNFEKLSSLEIYVDGVKKTPSKKYKFDREGEHNVTFEVYEDLKMDFMYQNVLGLRSINMTSDKEAKITSMKSTFENCENVEKITISGFNTLEIESMSKIFYGTNLSIFDIDGLETNNIKDMSYLFANNKANKIDLSKLDISKLQICHICSMVVPLKA